MQEQTRKTYTDIEAVDIIHQVATLYTSTKVPHDYGTGEICTSVEVHTIKHIEDHYGITVTEMARDYGKTKGAISQILKKVEEKGLIYRVKDEYDDKRLHLYLTEKGKLLDQAHRRYDEQNAGQSMSRLRERFSPEEIDVAFNVLESWLEIRRQVQAERLANAKKSG